MKQGNTSKSVVIIALFANLAIAVVKFIAAAFTASSAMLAESIHSLADSINQIFLLVGMKKGEKAPSELHPFGHSGELYFWSFIVAIILFSAGGVFSIKEGIHKLSHPQPINNINWAFIVLGISLVMESYAFYKVSKAVSKDRKGVKVLDYLRKTKKSEMIVVYLEDLAALTGLVVAIVFISLQHFSRILVFDGIASIVIGLLLCTVAVFLGNEIRSLLIGESADPKILKEIGTILDNEESIEKVIHIKSLQLGPDDILLSVKAEFNHRLTAVEISNIINGIESEIRQKHPDVKKIFIEPDIYKNG
ncbi:MAG: cation transporter [bacterium]|nr:cation transporter [bacterium]